MKPSGSFWGRLLVPLPGSTLSKLMSSAPKSKRILPTFGVGDHVGVRFGTRVLPAIVIEDRGNLGPNGSHLLRVESIDSGQGATQFEVPELALVTKNDGVWRIAQIHHLIVKVDTGKGVVSGYVLEARPTVVIDVDGSAVGSVALDVDGDERLVARTSRVLAYGRSSWKNLIASQVFAAAETAANDQGRSVNSHFVSAMKTVLMGDEKSVGPAVHEALPSALSGAGGLEHVRFIDALRFELEIHLKPRHPDEINFASTLIAEAFGGHAETYARTWGVRHHP